MYNPSGAAMSYSMAGGAEPALPAAFANDSYATSGAPLAPGASLYSAGGGVMSYAGVPSAATAVVDTSLNCDPSYMQLTMGAIPAVPPLAASSCLPFGLCVHPLAQHRTLPKELPLVDFGPTGVIRCKRCRTYINPFVTFSNAGRTWKCNICANLNDVPHLYHSPIDDKGRRADMMEKPELSRGSVEFVAPVEYMIRPPQAPVYMFVIDVSMTAVASGMLETVCAAIKDALPKIPGGERTQIGIMTYDSCIHFYNLRPTLSSPHMIVVPDISDVFLPLPEDLLVNLSESRGLVDMLLDSLPKMHASSRNVDTCLGSALDAAFAIIQHIGGKMVVCQCSLPSVGKGKLKHRENPKMFGSDTENVLLAPDTSNDAQYYKMKAVDFSRQQISVDMFLVGATYVDVATLGCVPRYTSGHVYYYPVFNRGVDDLRLRADLIHDLNRITGFEAVMRIRCTKGLRVSNFYGNFFIRGTDLLALPNVTEDTAFNLEIQHEEALLPGSVIGIQAALLYTTSSGERRINVHTMSLPVTTVLTELFKKVDVHAVSNMISKLALDTMLRTGVSAARTFLHKTIVDIVRAYRNATSAAPTAFPAISAAPQNAGVTLPEELKQLPLFGLALQKSVLFRGGTDVKSDERSALIYRMLTMPVMGSKPFIYPTLLALHRLGGDEGTSDPTSVNSNLVGPDSIILPPSLPLTVDSLVSDGMFLLFDGVETFIWLGRAAPPSFLEAMFGCSSFEGVDVSRVLLPLLPNPFSERVNAIVNALHSTASYAPRVTVTREGVGAASEVRFHWRLVEDRASFLGGVAFSEYATMVARESQMASSTH